MDLDMDQLVDVNNSKPKKEMIKNKRYFDFIVFCAFTLFFDQGSVQVRHTFYVHLNIMLRYH